MKIKNLYSIVIFIILPFLFISCGTSIATRYESSKGETKKIDTAKIKYAENFDLSNYRAKLLLPDVKKDSIPAKNEIWYNYKNPIDTSSNKPVVKTVLGFRVLTLTSDNLDDANNIKAEITSKTGRKDIYIIFDPPFYKVQVGDFKNIDEANDLSYQLKQMGFGEAKVISTQINIFQ